MCFSSSWDKLLGERLDVCRLASQSAMLSVVVVIDQSFGQKGGAREGFEVGSSDAKNCFRLRDGDDVGSSSGTEG